MTVAILLVPLAGMDVAVAVQTLVKGGENPGHDGRAPTSLILTRTASDGVELAVALLIGEYGMIMVMMMLLASGIVAVRPRSRVHLITSAYALLHRPSRQ
jgi:hypothetical protein